MMSTYKPESRNMSWDACKEDYLMWEKAYEAENPQDYIFEDEVGFFTVGIKTPIIYEKDCDNNTRTNYYKEEDGSLKLYNSKKALVATIKDISKEELESFHEMIPYDFERI